MAHRIAECCTDTRVLPRRSWMSSARGQGGRAGALESTRGSDEANPPHGVFSLHLLDMEDNVRGREGGTSPGTADSCAAGRASLSRATTGAVRDAGRDRDPTWPARTCRVDRPRLSAPIPPP
ncbi:hypothetical protein BHM03_00006270 [Ensete ventricosum]|nr:hypothetical protein BHM03_00006270 [Ensete ventricosum]